MSGNPPISDDRRFHFEIWSGPNDAFYRQKPSILYVENHNADFDYGLAMEDFKIATDVLIDAQKGDPYLGNLTAPVCHMIRQTIELQLKWLLQALAIKADIESNEQTFSHNLQRMWTNCKDQLAGGGYTYETDTYFENAERLIENLHHIDPAGDLFRFGVSRQQAFGRAKTYDRVDYEQETLFIEFEETYQFLAKWSYKILNDVIDDDGLSD